MSAATPLPDGGTLSGFVAHLKQEKSALWTELCSEGLDYFDRHAVKAQMASVDAVLARVDRYAQQAAKGAPHAADPSPTHHRD